MWLFCRSFNIGLEIGKSLGIVRADPFVQYQAKVTSNWIEPVIRRKTPDNDGAIVPWRNIEVGVASG